MTGGSSYCCKQRHKDRRPITTACPGYGQWGLIIICTGLTGAAKTGQKSIVLARQAQRNNQGRTSVICIPRVPICRSFNSQQVPPLSVLEFIDPVFAKTSPKRSFLVIENASFGLDYAKTGSINSGTVAEIIDPVFSKTSPKRSFCMTENERFGLVFVKTGSINSGTSLSGCQLSLKGPHSLVPIPKIPTQSDKNFNLLTYSNPTTELQMNMSILYFGATTQPWVMQRLHHKNSILHKEGVLSQ